MSNERRKDWAAVVRHGVRGGMRSVPVYARAFGITWKKVEEIMESEGILRSVLCDPGHVGPPGYDDHCGPVCMSCGNKITAEEYNQLGLL